MKITSLNISSLIPYEFNNRNHNQEQVDRIANSIESFGFNQPIVIDESNIILVGHGRLLAAQKLGLKEVPILQLKDLTETQKKAYRILDNKLQNDSTWSFDNLELELGFLEDNGFDLTAWGLDDLRDMFPEEEPEVTEDDFNPDDCENEKTFIKLGDLIELGEHRLMCGDSVIPEHVTELMNGKIGALFNTDPPYGIAYVSNAKSKGQSVAYEEIENDELDGEVLQEFLENAIRAFVPHIKPNCPFYLWHPMLTQGTFFAAAAAAAAADVLINRQIIWVKPQFIFGRGDYHWKHELCFYGWIKGNKPDFYGERNQSTVWEIGRENDKIHPTQKPLELFEIPIKNHTKKGEIVVEPFSGSGSQLIAADQLGRICYGMEISPKYCHVIIERYKKHCEKVKKPFVCKINGQPFGTIKEDGTGKEIRA
jgi:DNA modification methylase